MIVGEGPTFGINRKLGQPEKSLVLLLLKQTQKIVWVCNIMLIIVIC